MTDEQNMPAIVETIMEQADEFTVFATNPADMIGAQRSMILWCARKIQSEKVEMAEAQTNLDAAKAHEWSSTAWAKQVRLRAEKIECYRKIKIALEAGYYIVPPFPVDTFAIRVKNTAKPKGSWRDWRSTFEQTPALLASGEGKYVSPHPTQETKLFQVKNYKGEVAEKPHYRPIDFRIADFPFKLAKAEIMEATRAAMALKVFDRMGALPAARAPDPIICGDSFAASQRAGCDIFCFVVARYPQYLRYILQ